MNILKYILCIFFFLCFICLDDRNILICYCMISLFIRVSTGTSAHLCNSWFNFSFCHWNLNSLTTQNFKKVNILDAYNTVNKFDIICLSESFFDSSILTKNNNLKINGEG